MDTLSSHAKDSKTLTTSFEKVCLQCEKTFITSRANAKFCSADCRILGNGRLSAKKRGDALRGRGEGKTYTKYMGRHMHRVVVEQMIGRLLRSDEIVHHINGNKKDNRPENLAIIDRVEHGRIHSTKYAQTCIIEGCDGKHRWKGYCERHRFQIRKHGRIMST